MIPRRTPLAVLASLLLAQLGCGSDDPAVLKIAVQKQTSDGCYATMTGEPAPSALRLPSCGSTAPAELISGADRVRVIVDYDVPFAEAAAAPSPTLRVMLDGVETPTGASNETQIQGDRRWSVSTFIVPARPADELRISVETPSGYSGNVPESFKLKPPVVDVNVAQCPADGLCEMLGGVGSAQVELRVPGSVTQSVALTSSVDGIEEPAEHVVDTKRREPGVTVGVAELRVPVAEDAATWTLTARLGAGVYAARPITLRAPPIRASIGCTSPCEVKAGSTVGLTVTAPLSIHATQAVVRTAVDGVPGIVGATLDLNQRDVGARTLSGVQTLTVPTPKGDGAAWQIDVNVAGYAAQSILATIDP
ncbi:hypothetical protein [Sorangium sp. So ce131]|uniref:hypothetical protein n=1 Tax=Sorangium sp. So ce131 TaxID=3133282 RepID=UPI003F625B59